jgi:hypothetical protein
MSPTDAVNRLSTLLGPEDLAHVHRFGKALDRVASQISVVEQCPHEAMCDG